MDIVLTLVRKSGTVVACNGDTNSTNIVILVEARQFCYTSLGDESFVDNGTITYCTVRVLVPLRNLGRSAKNLCMRQVACMAVPKNIN